MKWIFMIVIVFVEQLHAQNVIIKIIPQNIIVKDDTLFFKYKVCNKTTQRLVFYGLNDGDFKVLGMKDSMLKNGMSRIFVSVLNEKGILPKALKMRTLPFYDPLLSTIENVNSSKYSVTIVNPNDSIDLPMKLPIYPISLKKGHYRLLISYMSTGYYDKEYYERKKTDPLFKNTHQFKGILKSKICEFNF